MITVKLVVPARGSANSNGENGEHGEHARHGLARDLRFSQRRALVPRVRFPRNCPKGPTCPKGPKIAYPTVCGKTLTDHCKFLFFSPLFLFPALAK